MKLLHITFLSNMFYAIFVPTTKVIRETKEFFNFEIRLENYTRVTKALKKKTERLTEEKN